VKPAALPTAHGAKGAASPLLRPAVLNARAILLGTTLPKAEDLLALASAPDPWAELLAIDAALDAGDLAAASLIAPRLGGASPERAARRARLARYRGDLVAAEAESRLAIGTRDQGRGDGGDIWGGDTPASPVSWRAVVERLLVLVARKERGLALDFTRDYPFDRDLQPFAEAIARGGARELRDPGALGPDTPVPVRLLIARAYGAARDRNAGFTYVQRLVKAGFTNPDVALAAEGVNLPPVTSRSLAPPPSAP
jgi:hypothetical protein